MLFAESETSSAFWVAIIVAIGGVVSNVWNAWLQYRANLKTKAIKDELTANTQLTKETRKEVNGRMEQLITIAKENAHREGFEAGKKAAEDTKPQ